MWSSTLVRLQENGLSDADMRIWFRLRLADVTALFRLRKTRIARFVMLCAAFIGSDASGVNAEFAVAVVAITKAPP